MFLENSRYHKQPAEDVTLPDGRTVTALKLRPLPTTSGDLHEVKDNDQLDVLAHGATGDGTKFWRIAECNTALEARALVLEAGAIIRMPRA